MSLSVSPISVTQHLSPRPSYGYTKFPIKSWNTIAKPGHFYLTLHPQIIASAEWTHAQAIGGVLIDTESQIAAPFLVGPLKSISNNFAVGLLVGGLIRGSHFPPSRYSYKFGPKKFTGNEFTPRFELLPMYGITGSYSVGKIKLQALLNHEMINMSAGVIIF